MRRTSGARALSNCTNGYKRSFESVSGRLFEAHTFLGTRGRAQVLVLFASLRTQDVRPLEEQLAALQEKLCRVRVNCTNGCSR